MAFAGALPTALLAVPPGVVVAPLGPARGGGALLGAVSARATVAVFVAFALVAWGTLSRSIRDAPSLDELHGPGAAPAGTA